MSQAPRPYSLPSRTSPGTGRSSSARAARRHRVDVAVEQQAAAAAGAGEARGQLRPAGELEPGGAWRVPATSRRAGSHRSISAPAARSRSARCACSAASSRAGSPTWRAVVSKPTSARSARPAPHVPPRSAPRKCAAPASPWAMIGEPCPTTIHTRSGDVPMRLHRAARRRDVAAPTDQFNGRAGAPGRRVSGSCSRSSPLTVWSGRPGRPRPRPVAARLPRRSAPLDAAVLRRRPPPPPRPTPTGRSRSRPSATRCWATPAWWPPNPGGYFDGVQLGDPGRRRVRQPGGDADRPDPRASARRCPRGPATSSALPPSLRAVLQEGRVHADEQRQQPRLRLLAGGPRRHRRRARPRRAAPHRPHDRDHPTIDVRGIRTTLDRVRAPTPTTPP